MTTPPDAWSVAEAYEQFMGRWSRRLAPEFLSWLRAPPRAHWLDVGCGTGALTSAICGLADPASVVACDTAAAFIEGGRTQISDSRVPFAVASADNLPVRVGGYGSITSLLALNFFPDPGSAVRRMTAAASEGGLVSACVWDYAHGMQFLRRFWDVAVALVPAAAERDGAFRFKICEPSQLQALFNDAGLVSVECAPVDIATIFPRFDDFWPPLLGGTGPAPAFVASLNATMRLELRRRLETALPIAADGSVSLRARAWAVRGIRD